jgi:hypothetical protein
VDLNKLIERVRLLLTSPKTEWPVIATEPATVAGLYKGYILYIAALSPLFTFLKFSVFGFNPLGLGAYHTGIGAGIAQAVMSYALSLVYFYVVALIVNALAPTFGGQKDKVQALKTVAYAFTASAIASVGLLLPWLGVLIVIAGVVYSIYLLYLGLPHTMKAPADRAAGYTAVTLIVAIVLFWIISLLTAGILGATLWHTGAGYSSAASSSGHFDKDSPLGKLEAMSERVDAANRKLEAAQKSGDTQAQGEAMSAMMGAVLGGAAGSAEALAPDRLKAFVPEALNGLARTEVSAERNGALGIQVATASGQYSDDTGRHLRLEITDSGGARGLIGLAGWATLEQERETSSGYERTRKENGRMVHEQWDRDSGTGEYGVVLGERFLVKVAGKAASVDDLKAAIAGIDLAGLEALRNEGVKRD